MELEEATGKQLEDFKLGKLTPLDGGGMSREGTAGIEGQERKFQVVQIEHRASIVDVHVLLENANTVGATKAYDSGGKTFWYDPAGQVAPSPLGR